MKGKFFPWLAPITTTTIPAAPHEDLAVAEEVSPGVWEFVHPCGAHVQVRGTREQAVLLGAKVAP